MPEEMCECKVVLTWEAMYDVVDIMDYIELEFGKFRARQFQREIKKNLSLSFVFGYFGIYSDKIISLKSLFKAFQPENPELMKVLKEKIFYS